MTVISNTSTPLDESLNAVKLARYAQIAGYSECELFGVFKDPSDRACDSIFTHAQRARLVHYLGEAQDEIEQVVGYPLSPKYFVAEQMKIPSGKYRYKARWTRIIGAGVKAVTMISAAESVDHTTDPAVVGALATTVTDPDEIRVYHPGTTIEIIPSKITIAGGNVTIEIPRCRMVLAALEDTPPDGLDYNDTANFEAEVDVAREYLDTTDPGVLVYPHLSTCGCCASCSEVTADACVYVRDARLGFVDVMRAEFISSVWTAACACQCCPPTYSRINYLAGLETLTPQAEDAIVRLAHAKMPSAPCGCGSIMELWTRDRHTPETLTRERENCPFGMSDGAWIAWRFANSMRTMRGSVL